MQSATFSTHRRLELTGKKTCPLRVRILIGSGSAGPSFAGIGPSVPLDSGELMWSRFWLVGWLATHIVRGLSSWSVASPLRPSERGGVMSVAGLRYKPSSYSKAPTVTKHGVFIYESGDPQSPKGRGASSPKHPRSKPSWPHYPNQVKMKRA